MKKLVIISFFFLLSLTSFSQITVTGTLLTKENGAIVPLEFANVVVISHQDTTKIVQGVITKASGAFEVKNLSQANYKVVFSYIGYKEKTVDVDLSNVSSNSFQLDSIYLNVDTEMLSEILVEAKRVRQDIDKQVYTFSREKMDKARESRELLLNIPQLRIDKISNTLASTDNKSIIILVNGVKANDAFLKMIPAHKVKRVDFYDIPPIRYGTNGKVLNIVTKELDAGVAIDFYGITGQMFTQVMPTISYISGRNMFTLEYIYHLNPKRSTKDLYSGEYKYKLAGDDYTYKYEEEKQDHGNQNVVALTYTNHKEDSHVFQAKVRTGFDEDNRNETKNINISKNNLLEQTDGFLTNRVKTFSPTVDIYYSKQMKNSRQLDFNLVGTWFENKQQMLSVENGTFGFSDNLNLKNSKKSLIGEISYYTHINKQSLNFGYKTSISALDNTVSNILTEGSDSKYKINIQNHYLYSETKGRISQLMYRLSLGANLVRTNSEEESQTNLFFMPQVLLGYNINDNNSIRLVLESASSMPNAQQLSNNAIVVMNNFISRGNPELKNSIMYEARLKYGLNYKGLTMSADLFYENHKNEIFKDYKKGQLAVDGNNYIIMTNENAHTSYKLGGEINAMLILFDFLTIGTYATAYRHTFQPTKDAVKQSFFFYPISAYASADYKNLTISYQQMFNSSFLEGFYIKGVEKVSYFNLSYRLDNWIFGVNYYFPFHKDDFKNYTYPNAQNILTHEMRGRLKTKEKTIGVSATWNFNSTKKDSYVDRNIYNEDFDKGTFEVK